MALSVQIFLKMDRPDLASKTVRQMQAADEDNTLTQLALAWTHLAAGGAKLQEAQYLYDELADKFEATVNPIPCYHIYFILNEYHIAFFYFFTELEIVSMWPNMCMFYMIYTL